MTFEAAKMIRDRLDAANRAASDVLQSFPKLANGLTTDAVKATADYRIAKENFAATFAGLRKINGFMSKRFSRELKAERDARRAARVVG